MANPRLQAEMSRFEQEIGGFPRPPMPNMMMNPSMQFIPHALRQQPMTMPPNSGHNAPVIPPPHIAMMAAAAAAAAAASSGLAPPGQQMETKGGPGPSAPLAYATPSASSSSNQSGDKKKTKKPLRSAGGAVWEDWTMSDWDTNDFRLFCGDLGNEVSDELLAKAFRKYPSFQRAKVVRDKRTNKSRGYGFVSFKDPQDFMRAMREMDGKYVGNRPIKLRKSNWKERNFEVVKKKAKEKKKLGFKM